MNSIRKYLKTIRKYCDGSCNNRALDFLFFPAYGISLFSDYPFPVRIQVESIALPFGGIIPKTPRSFNFIIKKKREIRTRQQCSVTLQSIHALSQPRSGRSSAKSKPISEVRNSVSEWSTGIIPPPPPATAAHNSAQHEEHRTELPGIGDRRNQSVYQV